MGTADPMEGRIVARTPDADRQADSIIERVVVAELRLHPWANMTSAFVRNRSVLLCGCIGDEERRADLVAIVAGVSGVRSVTDRLMVIHATPRVAFAVEGN